MNTMETLTSRKSIRSYTGEQISSNELDLLLKAANAALANDPSLVSKLGLPDGFAPSCGVAIGKTDEKYTVREIPEERIAMKTLG